MRLLSCLFGGVLLLASDVHAADPVVYIDPAHRFRLTPPVFEPNTTFGFTSTPVVFSGPLADGQSPNCNVQVQNPGLTQVQYLELSRNQFKSIGFSIESETEKVVSGKPAVVWKYNGKGVKAIAMAVFAGKHTFVVTCMAATEQFADLEESYMATIRSFSLESEQALQIN